MSLVTITLIIIEIIGFVMGVCYRHKATSRVEVTLGTTAVSAALATLFWAAWEQAQQPVFIDVSPVVSFAILNWIALSTIVTLICLRRAATLA